MTIFKRILAAALALALPVAAYAADLVQDGNLIVGKAIVQQQASPIFSGEKSTAITTVGAGTLTAAAITGGIITRSGSVAAYTDTTDTAVAIVAALPASLPAGAAMNFRVKNTVAFPETIAAGAGITLTGNTVVPPNSTQSCLLTVTSATAVAINCVSSQPIANIADVQYSTAALQSAVIPAANMAGSKTVAFENTGVTPANLQSDTAANIVAAIPNAQIGMAYVLRVRNSSSGANTATVTTNTGITLHGTMTIAQNVTREFIVVLTSLTAVDIYSMGVSAAAV